MVFMGFKIIIRLTIVLLVVYIIQSKIKKTYDDVKNVVNRIFMTGVLCIYLGCEIIWEIILEKNVVFSSSLLISGILYIFYTLATTKDGTESEKEES